MGNPGLGASGIGTTDGWPTSVSSPVKWGCPSLTLGNRREGTRRDRKGALSSLPPRRLPVSPGLWPSCVRLGIISASESTCQRGEPGPGTVPSFRGTLNTWHAAQSPHHSPLSSNPRDPPLPPPQCPSLSKEGTLTVKLGSSCRKLTGHLSAAIWQSARLGPHWWSEWKQSRDATVRCLGRLSMW